MPHPVRTRTRKAETLRLATLSLTILIATLSLTILIVTCTDRAVAQAAEEEEEARSDWEIVLGAGTFYSPVFEGAEDYEFTALPFVSIGNGEWVVVDPQGLAFSLNRTGPLFFRTRLGYDFGRDEGDDSHLAGLGDIDGGVTLAFGVDFAAGPFDLYTEFEHSFGDSDGLIGKFGAEYSRPVGKVLLGAGVVATWADDNYMQTYFGVT